MYPEIFLSYMTHDMCRAFIFILYMTLGADGI